MTGKSSTGCPGPTSTSTAVATICRSCLTRVAHELPSTHVYRVLKPDGRLRVSVPNLEMLCRLFLHPSFDGDARWNVMRMMFGGRTSEHDVHHSGLTLEFMLAFLSELGFRDIKRVQKFRLSDDSSTLTFGGVPVSVNVEAWR